MKTTITMASTLLAAGVSMAQVVNFDLTPDGQIALAGGGVKGKIVAAMRARAKLPNRRAASN